ncbi:MAG: hypothetical protein AAB875_04050, partial [Patescibacteria group bacterium]
MSTLYKWTDAGLWTRAGKSNALLWGEGVRHGVAWGGTLCEAGCLHAYRTPLLAVLLDRAHGRYTREHGAILWECGGEVRAEDGAKVGCGALTTVRRVEPPVVTTAQRVRFAVLCAQADGRSTAGWQRWAERWLSGEDRTRAAATDAAFAAAADAAAEAAHLTVLAAIHAGSDGHDVPRAAPGERHRVTFLRVGRPMDLDNLALSLKATLDALRRLRVLVHPHPEEIRGVD